MRMHNERIRRACTDPAERASAAKLSDELVIQRARDGDVNTFELIMRRYNQRLFRIARGIIRDDDEATDVVQETDVRAYEHLSDFEGRSKFSTWLTKIAVNNACTRRRRFHRLQLFGSEAPEPHSMSSHNPFYDAQARASNNELQKVLTDSVDQLPDDLRSVFTLRVVDGLNTQETAECLNLSNANVKTRLHRARVELRTRIDARIGADFRRLYQFGGQRCNQIVGAVLARLQQLPDDTSQNENGGE